MSDEKQRFGRASREEDREAISAITHNEPLTPLSLVLLVILGAVVGLLSGIFGVGGGSMIVPALVMMGLSQREAAATSLAAIIPTSISGVISYAVDGNVDWIAAILLAVGMLGGTQVGSWLLSKLSERFLRWFFVAFMIFVAVQEFTTIPSRDQSIRYTVWVCVLIVVFGFIMGVLAGLLGIGGGAVAVPALSILFGASDLIARGTSLLAMFPGSLAGTVANFKRNLVHLRSGLIIGITAAIIAPLGTWLATLVSPHVGSILFGSYLAIIVIRSTYAALRVR
ncbi:MAG: sulfite exporter TauE/SafE family protein [Bifidobacteriaceae bacterium]|jgi:uncharacterized membrane protein YfcA|nr:sulfite exporter TauE/SafE family protein [Bifidobacteriaceae bacterium]MCI1914847.1 sulfite exporter TauE/SafE family protein [Bifidobacteriaceae bacterium]